MRKANIDATTLVLDSIAVYRLSRLATLDTFPPIKKARDALHRMFPDEGMQVHAEDGWTFQQENTTAVHWWKIAGMNVRAEVGIGPISPSTAYVTRAHPLGEIAHCPWCVSWYFALFALVARRYAPRVWDPFARALVASAAAGFISVHA